MEAYVYIYTFTFLLFFKLQHTEIRYGTVHVGYGPNGLRVSQIARRSMKLKRIIYAGSSDVTMEKYFKILRALQIIVASKKYCLFRHNCRHISIHVLTKLGCNDSEGN